MLWKIKNGLFGSKWSNLKSVAEDEWITEYLSCKKYISLQKVRKCCVLCELHHWERRLGTWVFKHDLTQTANFSEALYQISSYTIYCTFLFPQKLDNCNCKGRFLVFLNALFCLKKLSVRPINNPHDKGKDIQYMHVCPSNGYVFKF
jgi:hypothetical protein